jgi:hypothetical protein
VTGTTHRFIVCDDKLYTVEKHQQTLFKSNFFGDECKIDEQPKCFSELAYHTTYLTKANIAKMLRDPQISKFVNDQVNLIHSDRPELSWLIESLK